MTIATIFWKQAGAAVARALPDMVYLFDAFMRRKAQKFRTISQDGTKFKRVTVTAALAITAAAASYLILQFDPFDGLGGIMPRSERAFWTALVPLISAFVAYWLMRWTLAVPLLSTFVNLGLVTCIALTVIPGVLSLAGANASTLASDIREFRAGRGAGTPVHRIYCSTLEEQAEIGALMRRLNRNGEQLMQNGRFLEENSRALLENTRALEPNGQRLDALGRRILEAGGPERADPAMVREFGDTMREGLNIMRQGIATRRQGQAIRNQGLVLHREGIAILERALDLQNRQTTAPYRLLNQYRVATAFLVIAIIAGILMWLFSAVIAWKLVVTPQTTRKRKITVGTALVLVFLLVSAGSSILRSGLVEVYLQEPPELQMIEAQLRNQFAASAPMCGRLNNHGLW